MKLKITPLNIVAAVSILAAILLMFKQLDILTFQVSAMRTLFVILFIVAAIVAFISDLIFRRMVPSLKRLWIIELTLITLTVVMALIMKSLF